jgi:hypothetical protein
MSKNATAFTLAFLIAFILGYGLLTVRIYQPIEGVTALRLVRRCELEYFDTTLQPFNTMVLSCPRMDMIRLWPFPVVHPWFEDWFETPAPPADGKIAKTFTQQIG